MQSVTGKLLAGLIFLGAVAGFSGLGTAIFSPANAAETEPNRVAWKYLSFRGNHFLGKVKTEVSLAGLPTGQAQKILIAVPQGSALQASTACVMVLDVQSAVDPLFGATDISGSQAWFTPDDAAALQRIRSRRGDDIWQNTYRFTQNGVYRIRKKPAGADEKQLAPERWTKIKESFYAYQDKRRESLSVLEPNGLLYLASARAFVERAAPRTLYVFDRKQLHEVRVQVSGRQRLKVSYIEKNQENDIRREGMTDTLKISFKPRALASPGQQPEEFSFMGLKGDFEIYIDAATGIPVQISGQIANVGKVHIRLQTVEMAQKKTTNEKKSG
jgi:hypothetical protein